MKTTIALIAGAIVVGGLSPKGHAGLTVHEWGTFTVYQGSNGQSVKWYLGDAVSELPKFVALEPRELMMMKQSYSKHYVRMETPVLYFYPDKEMPVTVKVTFPQGKITESFPYQFSDGEWRGQLLAPTEENKRAVPAAEGDEARHYAPARQVPDAWLFHGTLPKQKQERVKSQFASVKQPWVEQRDHFLFYRGKGDNLHCATMSAVDNGDSISLTNYSGVEVPVLYVVRAGKEKAGWTRVESLAPVQHVEGRAIGVKDIPLPAANLSKEEATGQLSSAMRESLQADGLTKAEAEAMVATWDTLWFEEPGTRVLALMPKEWIENSLQVQISPQPDKMERVFVLRLELLSAEKEKELVQLLGDPAIADGPENQNRLENLELGRFAEGAFERAIELKSFDMRKKFDALRTKR